MRIVILAAMDKEVALLLPLLSGAVATDLEGVGAHVGKIGDHDVCLLKCGIGKVNSALNAMRAIRAFNPRLVINSGVAGGADASMKVGSLLVATEAAYHDVWCGPGCAPDRSRTCLSGLLWMRMLSASAGRFRSGGVPFRTYRIWRQVYFHCRRNQQYQVNIS